MEIKFKVVFNRHRKEFFFSFSWGDDISSLPPNPLNIEDQWLWDSWETDDLALMLGKGYKWVSKPV